NVYTRAARYLREWRAARIVEQARSPAFYVYAQRFTLPGSTQTRIRKGFVGLGRLEPYANKIVYPHERTLSGPKQDRLQLLRQTHAQFEQLCMLYDDPAQRIDHVLDEASGRTPELEIQDEYGVCHRLWSISDERRIRLIQREMAAHKLIIADGHHRYETALA